MEALYLLVPLSIAIVFAAIWLFFRMSDGGQFDDLVSPGWRILQDDDKMPAPLAAQEIVIKDAAAAD
jgi:cbb3-type cytochrome oxidase maturation protein